MIIKKATTQSEFFGLMAVRCAVFMKEQQVDPCEEIDTTDQSAIHFIVEVDDHIVATCRIYQQGTITKLGRMAVLEQYRRRHLASSLIQAVEQQRKSLGIKTLELSAQLHAIPFYESCGFQARGEIFLDANIEHRLMSKHYG